MLGRGVVGMSVHISEAKEKQKMKESELDPHYHDAVTARIIATGMLMQRWANYDP